MKKGMESCCKGGTGGFPIFAWLLFIAALLWLLNDLRMLVIDVPWLSIFALLFGAKMLAKAYCCCK